MEIIGVKVFEDFYEKYGKNTTKVQALGIVENLKRIAKFDRLIKK